MKRRFPTRGRGRKRTGLRAAMGALTVVGVATLAAAALPVRGGPPRPNNAPPDTSVRFARDVQPLLSDNCFPCHGPDARARAADLRLDTEAGVRRVFVARRPDASPAFVRITAPDPARRMPPPGSNHALTPAQIALLRRWVAQGAVWEKHWAFVPPVRPPLPAVQHTRWPQNPVDRFVLARIESAGLVPSPPADRATLIRRVTLDLTGLPPSPDEVDAFLRDQSPDAYERVVDRLLASPRYGEHMAWPWLDAARYADTNGYQEDRTRTMWPWRDWVVRALNDNLPYDQFTVAQIAGDLLPGATLDDKIATGFHRNHMLNGEGGRIPEESRVEYVVDRVDTTATTWLGLTAGCARCHDHKFDPITQREYYQLFAYFNNVSETGGVDRGGSANPVVPLPTPEQRARIAQQLSTLRQIGPKLRALDARLRPAQPEWEQGPQPENLLPTIANVLKIAPGARTDKQAQELTEYFLAQNPERAALQTKRDAAQKALDAVNNAVVLAMVMDDNKPRDTFLLTRGAYDRPAEKVTAGVPAVLPPLPTGAPNNRLGLARWIVAPDNPLTPRVAVNRIWQTLFGTGLVKTAEDWGIQGERPTHPDLLDWLASEFVRPSSNQDCAWDQKRVVRLLVTSATYRQSSRVTPALLARDPDNRLLARASRYRLPSYVLRDQALAVSGLLVEKRGGSPVRPYQPEGVWEDFSYGKIVYAQDHGDALYRRSLYTFWRRSVAPTTLFDTAARRVCTVRQSRTNTPLQALTLLNDTTFVEAARALAERALAHDTKTPEQHIAWMFRTVTCRPPTTSERAILLSGFGRNRAHYAAHPDAARELLAVGESKPNPKRDEAELAAYAGVAGVILNLDEVLSKE